MTTGTPIAMQIDNVDQRSRDYSAIAAQFRPGHADLTYELKYGIRDYRGGGRSSARETAMRVAAGGVARKVLGEAVRIRGALVQIGPHRIDRARWDWDAVDDNPFFCPDPATATLWEAPSVRGAQGRLVGRRGDRGGGRGRPARPGRADLRQARCRDRRGADVDQRGEGRRDRRGLRRRGTRPARPTPTRCACSDGVVAFASNHAGGILGGISTGQPIVARFAVKPTSSILTPRQTVDRGGQEIDITTKGRHDPCVGIRAVPVGEAMLACVLADHLLRHRAQNPDAPTTARLPRN